MENLSCIKYVELSIRCQFRKDWIFYDEVIKETRYDLRECLLEKIPLNAIDEVVAMLKKHFIVLRIETPRKKTLGSFQRKHTICINNDLDKDRFLKVFLHEYAHLLTFLSFPKVAFHGHEFYYCFQKLVLKFISKNIIPESMFLPILNKTGDYEFCKKNNGFKFALKTIRVGSQFTYRDEIFVRGKGYKVHIDCTRLSDNKKFRMAPYTDIVPVLDLCW
jgi:hypothetical protein